jgi:hypothetical protein
MNTWCHILDDQSDDTENVFNEKLMLQVEYVT